MVHDQCITTAAAQKCIFTSGSLVDAAGVNCLRDSNRNKASDEESNEGV